MISIRHLVLAAAAAAALATAGCGSAGNTAPAAAPQPSQAAAAQPSGLPPAAPQPPAAQQVAITVLGGQVQGGPQRVEVPLGTPVSITVTGDEADEAHLHGYDRAARLSPGTPATIAFTADQPGVFELELHGSDALLAKLEVR